MSSVFKPVVIRIPVIPGVNDTDVEQRAIYSFILKLSTIELTEFLPFHRLGLGKYKGLGRHYDMELYESLSPESCEALASLARSMGLKVKIAGR